MELNHASKAAIWISRLFVVTLFIGMLVGFYHIISVAAAPAAIPAVQAANTPDCALLDNSQARGLMSGMFETKLLLLCGRANELGQIQSSPVTPAAIGLDVLVNDPSGDSGASRTQSETSLARNETSGVLCSAYNDSYHGVTQGIGYTGFSSSNDNGATWADHSAIPQGGGGESFGDPALGWRKSDGHFYIVTLHTNGLGFWDLGTNCTAATWVGMVHSSGNDDKELLAIDNNSSSTHYGRLYVAWTDFNNGHIYVTYSDNKTTWSTPVDVSGKTNVQGAWPAIDPVTNDVYVAWVHWDSYPDGPIDIEIARSTNGGSTFTFVTNPANNVTNPRDVTATGDCGRPALKGDIRYLPGPEIVVDSNSNLHVVYSYDPDGYNSGDVINVYYRRSTDHGATWGPEIRLNDDATTRDQFFPALAVTPSGIVGAFWYDRRLDGSNLLFDYYKTVSYDNGLTFGANERVSDVSSPVVLDPNLATCYHGDYDTSKADNTRFYIQWADDRGGTPDVYMDTELTVPDFTLAATPDRLGVCMPNDGQYNVSVEPLLGFSQPVTLNASGNPAGTTASFDVNPVTPPGTSLLTIGNTGGAAPGSYSIDITGIAPTRTHTTTVGLDLYSGVPGVPTLLTPADGATDQPFTPSFDWTDLSSTSSYNFELATSPLFESPVVITTGLTASAYTLSAPLDGGTCYWWHTQGNNTCGTGVWAAPFHFSTVALGVSFFDDMESGPGQWTHAAVQGTDHWAISTAQSHSPTHAWFVPDDPVITDSRLWTTNPILVGAGSTLTFWHQYQFEGTGFDGSVLEISTNGGGTWTDLGSYITANGYNGTISTSYGNPLGGQQAWTGDLTSWTQVTVDLSSFAGENVMIRWRLGCDSSVSDVGWYIDDVQITAPLPPNPAPTLISITPDSGDSSTPTPVVIVGSGFIGSPALKLGDTWLESVVVVNSTTIDAVVPAGMPDGLYDLTIYNGDCQSVVLLNAFTVTSVAVPISGLAAVNDSPTYLGDTTHLTATVETGNGVSYTWDFGDGSFGGGATPSHVYPDLGTFTAVVTATNILNSQTTTTTVSIVDAPITGLTATNDSPTELGSLTTLTATIATGTNVTYAWDFGDGATGSGAVDTHTYPATGSYTATVTATNGTNSASATTVVTITDVPITGLSAQNNSPTYLGDTTTLTATIVTGTGVTYNWDFGDGNSDSGQVTTHVYAAVGVYTATVTATNSLGSVLATTEVTIIPRVNYLIFLPVSFR